MPLGSPGCLPLVKQVEGLATDRATAASYWFKRGALAGVHTVDSTRSIPTEGKPGQHLTVAFPLFIKNRPKHFMYHTKISFAGGSHRKDWSPQR